VVVGVLVGFAGGIAAGPVLTDKAFVLLERAIPRLGMSALRYVGQRSSAAPAVAHLPTPRVAPSAGPSAPSPVLAPAVPTAAPAAAAAPPRPPAPAAAPPRPPAPAAAPVRAEVPRRPSARGSQVRSRAKAVESSGASRQEDGDRVDPFAPAKEGPSSAAPSTGGKNKAGADEPFPGTKSEPAAQPASAKAGDSLADLIADATLDRKSKKPEGKGIDAMLKEVQKSEPQPLLKHSMPADLPSLSASQILKVMTAVKKRSSECARRLGQKGIAELKITVGKNGRVTDVELGGKLAGTPLAGCIVQVTRSASFPPNSGLRFDYKIDAH